MKITLHGADVLAHVSLEKPRLCSSVLLFNDTDRDILISTRPDMEEHDGAAAGLGFPIAPGEKLVLPSVGAPVYYATAAIGDFWVEFIN